MAYIAYSSPKANGSVYAAVVKSCRKGSKVEQKRLENLGLVVDQERGVYKSRERGIFRYILGEGAFEIGSEDIESLNHGAVPAQEKLILDFGDSYVLDRYIWGLPIREAVDEILPGERDTLMSLLFYRILTDKKANCNARTWWDGNYACLLYPKAQLAGQRISEFLARLGGEGVQRAFFARYLDILYGRRDEQAAAILIDSTGLPNASGMSITQLNNHNGDISLEVRLIYVIDHRNGMPIYFRYCAGNIVDVSTMLTTIAELSQYNVNVDSAIIDAGYFSEPNVRDMYENGIHFVTRLAPNRKIFKDVTVRRLHDISSAKYAIRHGGRLVYMKKEMIDVYGYEGYAYIGVDMDSKSSQVKRATFNCMDDKLTPDEIDRRIEGLGVFVLLSSDDMDTKDVLPLYYTRQQVEQVFDIAKNNADILPLRTQNEDTFRGHLMLTFLATAILQKMQRDILNLRKKGDKTNPEGALMRLRNQKCKIYDRNIIPQEAVKEINAVYNLLGIKCPTTISKTI
ncbi:MAG: transposase [Oscillospiraceae bacterium]|nr:transposase [Oscillospiraceae bacterium]